MKTYTYDKVAEDDLQNLGLERSAAVEDLLHEPDENVAHGCADQSAICRHLRDSAGEVVAVLVAILSQPRGDKLLKACQRTSSEHLGAERVGLELLDVGLEFRARVNIQSNGELPYGDALCTGKRADHTGIGVEVGDDKPQDSPWCQHFPCHQSRQCRFSQQKDACRWFLGWDHWEQSVGQRPGRRP